MMKRLALILLIVLVAALTACGAAAPTPIPKAQISLTATDIAFDKNRLEVLVGQPMMLTLRNDGALEHDFSIMEMPHKGEVMTEGAEDEMEHDMSSMEMEPEIHVAAPLGESRTIEFTPTMPGEYEYFCTVAGHKEAGMLGTLVVKSS